MLRHWSRWSRSFIERVMKRLRVFVILHSDTTPIYHMMHDCHMFLTKSRYVTTNTGMYRHTIGLGVMKGLECYGYIVFSFITNAF